MQQVVFGCQWSEDEKKLLRLLGDLIFPLLHVPMCQTGLVAGLLRGIAVWQLSNLPWIFTPDVEGKNDLHSNKASENFLAP